MKPNIFILQSTYMEVSVNSLCLFAHELPYQTMVMSHVLLPFFVHGPPHPFPHQSVVHPDLPQQTYYNAVRSELKFTTTALVIHRLSKVMKNLSLNFLSRYVNYNLHRN